MSNRNQPTATPTATILIAEDEAATGEMLKLGLESRGHLVHLASSAAEARRLASEIRPDLIICDLVLPDANGLILCDDLRRACGAPVIVCSGTKRGDDRLLAYKLGADDFIAKPFDLAELQVRVEASLRRAARARALAGIDDSPAASPPPPRRATIGPLVVDHARCAVTAGDRALPVTPTEYRLLAALVERPNQLWRRAELAEHAWGHHDASLDRSLEVHLRRLRGKLKTAPGAPQLITLRGFGYKLVHEPESAAA